MLATLAVVVINLTGPASAQVFGAGLDVGAGARRDHSGTLSPRFVLGIPLTVRTGQRGEFDPRTGRHIRPHPRLGLYMMGRPEIGIGPTADTRYEQQTDDGGRSVCRDVQTGRSASTSQCIKLFGGVSAEAGIAVRGLRFGAGYRAGWSPQPLGSAALVVGSFFLRFEGGPRGRGVTLGLGQL